MTKSNTITREKPQREHPKPVHFKPQRPRPISVDGLNEQPKTDLFGLSLANSTLADAASAIVAKAKYGHHSIIQFINAHCVNTFRTDSEYEDALSHADALLPDGSGIALAARLSGSMIVNNLNGTDLFPALCEKAAQEGQSIFFLGGAPGIAAAAANNMRNRIPDLDVAAARNGYFNAAEEQQIIDEINASGASILLVGMGVPRQEIWIAKNRNRLHVPVVIGVGGLFDYYSGNIARAPMAFRSAGMEWVWRLMQEPKRLAKRYLLGNPLFICRAILFGWNARGYAEAAFNKSKRCIDILSSSAALLALAPVFAAISLLIKMEDGGDVFFSQTRIGADGHPFKIWKFRTMKKNAEEIRASLLEQSDRDSVCFKMKNDPRITKVGKWLRRFSLDELPQLFNVFKGDMAIVGPRPALPQEVAKYDRQALKRLGGSPGLTCSWQVSGRADIPFDEQVKLDVEYLDKRSILTDLMMIIKTVPAVISGRGAY